jgi:hypothetical protein
MTCTFQVSDDVMSSGDDEDWKAIGTSEKSRSPSLPKIDFKSKKNDGKILLSIIDS